MKKNIFMRLACVVLVLTLLSTCVISGTFAKYVTESETADNSARVAKWGVTIAAADNTMFEASYDTDDTDADASITVSVEAANGTDYVVAPGTTEEGMTDLTLAGTPEVAVDVAYTAELTLTGWTVGGADYCPIIFTVEDEDIFIDGNEITDVAGLEAAVEEAIEGCSAQYAPNTNLAQAATTTDAPTVSWRWEFEEDTLADYQTDAKDTALGNAAADGAAATIALTTSAVVTQID